MTIDEGIEFLERKANNYTRMSKMATEENLDKEKKVFSERADDFYKLATWLKDYKRLLDWEKDIKGKVYRNEHCDRAGKCIDYIGWHCAGCNRAEANS